MLTPTIRSSRATRRLFSLVFTSLLFAACQSSPAAPAPAAEQDPASLAAEFVRLFGSGELSVNAASALMGVGSTAKREGAYWQIRREDGQQAIVMRAVDDGKSQDDAELRMDLNAGLTLADLEKKFGPSKVVSESKTSSVSFRVAGVAGAMTAVFARLLTPNAVPGSPVISLQLRRDSSS